MKSERDTQKFYLLEALHKSCANGDAYVMDDVLFSLSKEMNKSLTVAKFRDDLSRQLYVGTLHREGRRIYDRGTWRYEESAAKDLSTVLQHPGFPAVELPDTLIVGDIALCEEQREAVMTALSHRLTLILGGAGCGKSTLIRAICDQVNGAKVLCAPTGKAARNMGQKTGLVARTIHSALGLAPNDDFLDPVEWGYTRLVVVDEVSMVLLESFIARMTTAGLFSSGTTTSCSPLALVM